MIRPGRAASATLVVLAALAVAPVPEARAGGTDRADQAKAGALFEKAQKHYQAGEYSAAIKLFTEAYELVHDPIYLFNLAQTYRKVLDCEKASEHYERYLAEAKDADAKQRERVQQWLREIAPCVQQRREDAERARRAEEEARAKEAEALRLERDAAARGPKEIDRGKNLRIAGIATAGAGVVGLGLGTYFSVRGSQLKSELADACKNGCNWADLEDKHAAGRRANVIAVVSWIGGGLALGGGATLYLLGRTRIERVQVAPAQGGATVSARFSF